MKGSAMMECRWFAVCDHIAAGLRAHPILGLVPICNRCAHRIDEPITAQEVARLRAVEAVDAEHSKPPQAAEWCPVCRNFHVNPGERTDRGTITRPCPNLATEDPVYFGSRFYTGDRG